MTTTNHPAAPVRLWITGASSGIGRALALHALRAGAKVALSARREDALKVVAEGNKDNTLILPFDIRQSGAAIDAAGKIDEQWGGLDWAVINAGDCQYINPRELSQWGGDDDAFSRMMEVNFLAAVRCARAAMPLLQKSRGLLAAVSSTAAFCPLPRAAAYGASKAALSYFVRAMEPHFPEVDFCVISPGFVKTPLTDRNDFPMPFLTSPEDAAAVIWRGLRARRDAVIFPRRLSFILRLVAALPSFLRRKLWARMIGGAES